MNENNLLENEENNSVEEELSNTEGRQNFVTSVPVEEEIEPSSKKKSLMPIFIFLGVVLGAAAIALFFIFRGKPENTTVVKDNSSKIGVNANVNNSNGIDFQSDYQKRYGSNANSNPIVSNSNTEIANPQYGNVGSNITAPPPVYTGQIYQPLQSNTNNSQVVDPVKKTIPGGSGEAAAEKTRQTTRVKAGRETEIVEVSKNSNGVEYRNAAMGRNDQGSLYFYDRPTEKTEKPSANKNYSKIEIAANAPVKPNFGTVLPVRILGSLHTLGTNGLARMELTRTVEGSWGYLPSGTLFVGRVSGGEADRLFVSLIGYLNDDNRLVPLGGDLQGIDGALGLKGQSKSLGSRWSKIFGELLSTAKNVGSAYLLGRNGGSGTIVNTGQLENLPERVINSGTNRYVVIPAGANGYVVINELPPAIQPNEKFNKAKDLSDEELLKLIQTNSNQEIQKMMPDLSNEGRTIAKRAMEN